MAKLVREQRGWCSARAIRFFVYGFLGMGVSGSVQAVPVERVSPFSTIMFDPNGEITEFITVPVNDSQNYFISDPALENPLDADFGAIKANARLTPGVLVRRDNFPQPGSDGEAGQTGYRDNPAIIDTTRFPTGFNIGRVFISYNPQAYGGEGAYFLSMDISAPAELNTRTNTQPIAFDVDGDNSRFTVTDPPLDPFTNDPLVSEVPTDDDEYRFVLFTDADGVADLRVTIGERAGGSIPSNAAPIDPVPAPFQQIMNTTGALVTVRRYVLVECLAGGACPPVLPADLPRFFLDANNDGALTAADVGVGSDVEIVIRRVGQLPNLTTPACLRVTYSADSFDDEPLGGGAEDQVMLDVNFPVPDLEVIKKARCVGEADGAFRDSVTATPDSEVEYRITVQNWGNRDLNVTLTDILTRVAPATASVVAGSCTVTVNPGAPFNAAAFCTAFEAGVNGAGVNNLSAGTLAAGSTCATGLGEHLVFTFRVLTGPAAGNAALCDQGIDLINAVSATGTVVGSTDPILAAAPALGNEPAGQDAEEEHCDDPSCCAGVPACAPTEVCSGTICVTVGCPAGACVPGDAVGDVRDEFTLAVSDDANMIDTSREVAAAADDNVAEVELECRNITFTKQVRRVGDANFQTGTMSVNISGDAGAYPLRVEYRYVISNTGEGPESFTLTDTNLCNDVDVAAGVAIVAGQCALCTPPTVGELTGTINAGASFMSSCIVEFSDLASATAFMTRDDARPACQATTGGQPDPLCYRNCANTDTQLGTPQSPVCDAGESFDSFAQICLIRECALDVNKQVVCLDSCPNGNPSGAPSDSLMTVPGACAQFIVTVENTGPVPIPLVCLEDVITCTWTISGFEADIDGDVVTADLIAGGFAPNSGRDCVTFPSHPGGLGAGETLTIRFDVQIPGVFPIVGAAVDCRNSLEADGYRATDADTTLPPDEECTDLEDATIDVKVPKIDCSKTVAVDFGNNGSIDIPATSSANITTVTYPLRLIYTLSARNTGEIPINGAQVCDNELVADAVAAGATVGPCDLCTGACDGVGDTCASLGVMAPGQLVSKTCEIVFDDQGEFDDFAGQDTLDGRPDCYTNSMRAFGTIEPPCSPPNFPRTVQSGICEAIICIANVPECPITKAKFDIWNENERRFSGTERCITSWDQRLLSRYTVGDIANHFIRSRLQTTKGKARIDGVASSVVCGDESIAAPLLGVAAKVVWFNGGEVEMSGISLVGTGTEAGVIKYDVEGGPGGAPGPAIPDPTARSGITEKGSLIVYPKVEIKWDNENVLIQDTFLDITNDYADFVRVYMYFVNGDPPLAAKLDAAGNEIERAHLGCNAVDTEFVLTPDQPMHWSALTGDGGGSEFPAGFAPFTILDPGFPPGRPDDDPRNPGGRVLRGYILAWAVNVDSHEIRWNHLAGDALIINYRDSVAWEYNTWNFPAVAGTLNGDLLLVPRGQLNLDGVEYAFPPDRLIMDFLAAGAVLRSGNAGAMFDTDLTLWAVSKDLRRP